MGFRIPQHSLQSLHTVSTGTNILQTQSTSLGRTHEIVKSILRTVLASFRVQAYGVGVIAAGHADRHADGIVADEHRLRR